MAQRGLDALADLGDRHVTDRTIESFAWSPDGTRLAVLRTTTTDNIVLLKGLKE